MKLKILALTSIFAFLNGCTTSEMEYKKLCNNPPKSYIDKNLINQYENEKSVYILSNKNDEWSYIFLLAYNGKWDFIEINLNKNISYGFPQEDGLFRIKRDFSFKDCIKFNSHENKHTIDGLDFCLSAEKINSVNSIVKLDINSKEINKYTDFIENKITINNKLFLKVNATTFNSDSGGYGCESDYYIFMYRGFMKSEHYKI